MAQRFVLLVDSDSECNEVMMRELTRQNYRVEAFESAAPLLSRKKDLPDLIVLCVDPKPAGWASSDRIRKADHLKNIPLLITSADALPEDFDRHSSGKRAANDYQHKPLTPHALCLAVKRLIGSSEESRAYQLDSPADVEINVAPADPMPANTQALDANMPQMPVSDSAPTKLALSQDVEDRTSLGATAVNANMDQEADAAFAAIGIDEDASVSLDELPADVPTRSVAMPPAMPPAMPAAAPVATPAPTMMMAAAVEPAPTVQKITSHDIDLGIDRISSTGPKPAAAAAGEAPATQFSREREFLNLREIINRKEKELLDLKDQIDAKERQMLDVKDKLREGQRRESDLETAQLELQKQVVAQNERLATFETEYAEMREREQKAKMQLDQLQMEKQAVEAELATLQKRHASDLAALNDAMQRKETETKEMMRQRDADFAAQMTAKAAEMKAAADEADQAAMSRLASQLEAQRSQLEATHQASMEQAKAEQQRLVETHERTVEDEKRRAAATLDQTRMQMQTERDEMITAAREMHQQKLRALEEAHDSLKAGIVERHQGEMNELNARMQELQNQLGRALEQGKAMAEMNKAQDMRLTEAKTHMAARDQRINELEQEAAMYQEQLLKAYQRIKGDQESVLRAKRALAIALGVLDEGGNQVAAADKPSS